MIGLRFMQGVLTGLSWPGVLIDWHPCASFKCTQIFQRCIIWLPIGFLQTKEVHSCQLILEVLSVWLLLIPFSDSSSKLVPGNGCSMLAAFAGSFGTVFGFIMWVMLLALICVIKHFIQGLRFTWKTSSNSSTRERIHFGNARLIGYAKRRQEEKNSMESNFNVEDGLGQHHCTMGWHLGIVHTSDSGANVFQIHSWMGNWDDRDFIGATASSTSWLLNWFFSVRWLFACDQQDVKEQCSELGNIFL